MRVDCGAQVLDDKVAIRSRGDPYIAVTHEPLDAVRIDALAQQLGSERVPQIVKAHFQVHGLRPEETPAQLRSGVSSAIRALHASRTIACQVVVGADCVPAPSTAVLVAFDDTGPRQGMAQNLLWVCFAIALGAIWCWEE
jgi:hypothetical protein